MKFFNIPDKKKKRKRIIAAAACALVLIAAVAVFGVVRNRSRADYKVLLEWDFNGGIGEFSYDAYFAGRTEFDVVPEGPDGSGCARITSTEGNDARFKADVVVLPNTYYRVTAKVKTENVVSPGKAAGANISSLYSYEYGGGLTGDNGWTDLTVYGLTSQKQKEATICFRLGFYSCDTTGTMWIDDVKIEQLSSLPAGASAVSFERSMIENNSGGSGGGTATQRDIMNMYYDGMKIGMIIVAVAFIYFAIMYRYGVLRDREKLAGIEHTVTILVPDTDAPEPVYDPDEVRSMPDMIGKETADPAGSASDSTADNTCGAAASCASGAPEAAEAPGTPAAPEAAEAPAAAVTPEASATAGPAVVPFVTSIRPLFKTKKIGYKGLNTGVCVIVILALGLLFRLVASVTAPQCSIDVSLFQSWGKHALEDGITNFYANAQAYSLDYPPLYMYFLWFNALVARLFGITDTAGFIMLVKLPSMLADIGIGWILYRMIKDRAGKNWTVFIISLWVMNPLSILDSAAWGQVDSMLALLCLLMVWFIVKDRFIPASVMFGLAVVLKPQGFFMLPVLGFALLRRLLRDREKPKAQTLLLTLKCALVSVGTVLVTALPFGSRMKPDFFSWLINLYVGTVGGYKGATVNSYNFYYVINQNWTPDDKAFIGGVSYFTFGMIMIVVSCLIAGAAYLLTKKNDAAMPFLIASSMIYMVTMFGPRMHERYFFPCALLLLAAVVYSNNKILLWIYGVLTGVNFLSVLSVMLGLELGGRLKDAGAGSDVYGRFYWAAQEPHRQVIAWLNLICCIALLAAMLLIAFNVIKTDSPRLKIWTTEDSENVK